MPEYLLFIGGWRDYFYRIIDSNVFHDFYF